MGKIVISESGKIRDVNDIELVEKIFERKGNVDPWVIIDDLVNLWAKKETDEAQAIVINVDQYREMQQDKTFGTTKLGKDQERRFKLAFPRTLQLMIRSLYKSEELPFDSKFFTEFGKRYPAFKIAEKD